MSAPKREIMCRVCGRSGGDHAVFNLGHAFQYDAVRVFYDTRPPVVPDTAAGWTCKACGLRNAMTLNLCVRCYPPTVPAAYPSEKARQLVEDVSPGPITLREWRSAKSALLSYIGEIEQERSEFRDIALGLESRLVDCSAKLAASEELLEVRGERIETMQAAIRKYEADTNVMVRVGGIVQLTKNINPEAYERMRVYWPALFTALDSLAENPQ